MLLRDLLFSEHIVEGKIQISCFNAQTNEREVYFEGDAEYCYPRDMINFMDREISYIYAKDKLIHNDFNGGLCDRAIMCIELCNEKQGECIGNAQQIFDR